MFKKRQELQGRTLAASLLEPGLSAVLQWDRVQQLKGKAQLGTVPGKKAETYTQSDTQSDIRQGRLIG